MKASLFFGITVLLLWACSPAKEVSKTSASLTQKNGDSTEYEIVIIDPRFDQWYLVNFSPAKDHSNEYYRSKNNMAAINWNIYYHKGEQSRVIDSRIDFEPTIDYGIEVNRKLYWYFQYIEKSYRIRLFGNASSVSGN